jgi:hypothetical protein
MGTSPYPALRADLGRSRQYQAPSVRGAVVERCAGVDRICADSGSLVITPHDRRPPAEAGGTVASLVRVCATLALTKVEDDTVSTVGGARPPAAGCPCRAPRTMAACRFQFPAPAGWKDHPCAPC